MAQPLTTRTRDKTRATARVAAALLGGYAFTWGFTAFGIAGLVVLGMEFHEAEMGIYLLAFLLYLGLFVWAFAAASLTRVWVVFVGGTTLMTLAALALQRTLVS